MADVELRFGEPIDYTLAIVAGDALPPGSEVLDERRWRWHHMRNGWQKSGNAPVYRTLCDLVYAEGTVTVSYIARRPR